MTPLESVVSQHSPLRAVNPPNAAVSGRSERMRASGPLHVLGLEEIDDGIWSIYFCHVLLAALTGRDYILRARERDGAISVTYLPGCTSTHSITLSARISSMGGILTPSALAVFMLIQSSNTVGCSTGSSLGFVPLRILST